MSTLLSWSCCRLGRLAARQTTQCFKRQLSYQSELLTGRSVIEIRGPDSPDFLQGLITNDVNHLTDTTNNQPDPWSSVLLQRSLYTMFLNTSGRVLYDGILFNSALTQEGGYLLDCDTSLAEKILKHLKMYKLRKKVKLQILPDYETWVVFDTDPFMSDSSEHSKDNPDNSAMAKDFKELDILKGKAGQDMADTKTHCTLDPRVKSLGFRLLAPTSAPELCYQLREMDGPHSYANLRYRLGVPEGAAEIESSKALPLEYNVEYAHGVSFHKGCYIGQELTARTHHTGVIRKRVMPIRFTQKRESPVEGGESIVNEAGKALGKFIAGDKTHGIGMMRLEECSKAEEVRLKSDPETTFEPVERPNWWPKQSPKKLQQG